MGFLQSFLLQSEHQAFSWEVTGGTLQKEEASSEDYGSTVWVWGHGGTCSNHGLRISLGSFHLCVVIIFPEPHRLSGWSPSPCGPEGHRPAVVSSAGLCHSPAWSVSSWSPSALSRPAVPLHYGTSLLSPCTSFAIKGCLFFAREAPDPSQWPLLSCGRTTPSAVKSEPLSSLCFLRHSISPTVVSLYLTVILLSWLIVLYT